MEGGQSVSSFGEALKVRRERVGLTQQGLADHATLSVRAIRDMETGRVQRPRQETVRLLAEALRLEGRTRSAFEAAARQQSVAEEPTAPPTVRNAIVGREAEIGILSDALVLHGDRLVSVIGLGGVGKTRLALEVAGRIHAGARWSVQWLDCSGRGAAGRRTGVRADAGFDGLAELIEDRPTLLVLDGADDALDPTALDELFRRCPGLRVLITARGPQGLDGEQVIPLAPLATPTPDQDGDPHCLAEVPAVRLLVSHLRRLRPGFRLGVEEAPEIAALCRYLDGLPRALEFAAGWALVQSPGQLLDRLAGSPFTLAAPPVTSCERGDIRDVLSDALAGLSARQRAVLGRLASEEGTWSVEQAVVLGHRSAQDWLGVVHELLSRGLLRTVTGRDGVRFTVLNLFRVLCREDRDRWLSVAGRRTAERPVLAARAG